ncbi:hypothetical protein ABTB15_19710, partial [Acinetobacter baumannii]
MAAIVIAAGLPPQFYTHWMMVDDEMMVGQLLWPYDTVFNGYFHDQGREFIMPGLVFRLIWLLVPFTAV